MVTIIVRPRRSPHALLPPADLTPMIFFHSGIATHRNGAHGTPLNLHIDNRVQLSPESIAAILQLSRANAIGAAPQGVAWPGHRE